MFKPVICTLIVNEDQWFGSEISNSFQIQSPELFSNFYSKSSPSANNKSCSKSSNLPPEIFSDFLRLLAIFSGLTPISMFMEMSIEKSKSFPISSGPGPLNQHIYTRAPCWPTGQRLTPLSCGPGIRHHFSHNLSSVSESHWPASHQASARLHTPLPTCFF
jgi:hypothetical protein